MGSVGAPGSFALGEDLADAATNARRDERGASNKSTLTTATAYCIHSLGRTSSPAAGRKGSGWSETMELKPVGSGDLLAGVVSLQNSQSILALA